MIQRVVAAELAIDPRRVSVKRLNTNAALNDPGAGSSRVTHIVGGAARVAARRLRVMLEDHSGKSVGEEMFDAIAAAVCADGPLEAVGEYDSARDSHGHDFSFSVFAIEVAVDRETGAVRVVDAVFAVDVGTIINPIAHQGQIDGGFVYGLGAALLEELSYEDGKVTTPNLGEYKLPTIKDLPPLRTILVPGTPGSGPFGAKQGGELSNSGVPPAILNAIYDAVGVRLTHFPITPERVYEALNREPMRP